MRSNNFRLKLRPRKANRASRKANSYEKMMKTLLLQNQQIIIQQQNMMFMVIKQLQPNHQQPISHQNNETNQRQQHHHHQHHQHQHQPQSHQQQQQHSQTQQQQHHHHDQHDNLHQPLHQLQHHQIHEDQSSLQSQQLFSQATASSIIDTHQQLQQVASQLQENLGNYLTPAASEQDPINDKQEDDDLAALLEGDGLLHNNLLYNPQTDIGSVTPFKNGQQQHLTPSYYSSGCESLTTPRIEQQRQPTTTNISQNVVKNLADSFKSPTKPKINVKIMSDSATGSMKNSKAKIIQRMNISEFLRHVHPETDENQKSTQ